MPLEHEIYNFYCKLISIFESMDMCTEQYIR